MKSRIVAAFLSFLKPDRHQVGANATDCSQHKCDHCGSEYNIEGRQYHFEDIQEIENEWMERGIIV